MQITNTSESDAILSQSHKGCSSQEAMDPGRALASVIQDMVYLSLKMDAFCVAFEDARRRTPINHDSIKGLQQH